MSAHNKRELGDPLPEPDAELLATLEVAAPQDVIEAVLLDYVEARPGAATRDVRHALACLKMLLAGRAYRARQGVSTIAEMRKHAGDRSPTKIGMLFNNNEIEQVLIAYDVLAQALRDIARMSVGTTVGRIARSALAATNEEGRHESDAS